MTFAPDPRTLLPAPAGFDVVGDVHGQLGALEALGRELGYDVAGGWSHPDGRVLVFLGDLVDRGPHSFEVARLACDLVERGRALGVMGNHEYNLIGHELGLERPKHSNASTIADVARQHDAWAPLLDQLRAWPLALELPDLRVIHAVWHRRCVELVRGPLGVVGVDGAATTSDSLVYLRAHVALRSPFDPTRAALVEGLPTDEEPWGDVPHAVLMKGYEGPADAPFRDGDGAERDRVRVTWWSEGHDEAPTDRTTVFGHYWNLPPHGDAPSFVPPFPSGHPALRAWQEEHAGGLPSRGRVAVPAGVSAVCVDYNGMMIGARRACVGALRWPEREVAWAVDETSRGE